MQGGHYFQVDRGYLSLNLLYPESLSSQPICSEDHGKGMCCTESKNMTNESKLYVKLGSDSYALLGSGAS